MRRTGAHKDTRCAHLHHCRLVCCASRSGGTSGRHGLAAHAHRRQRAQPCGTAAVHGDVHAWKDARQVNTLKRLGTRRAQWEAAQASGAPADGTTPMVVNAADMVGHLQAGVATPAYMCVGEGSRWGRRPRWQPPLGAPLRRTRSHTRSRDCSCAVRGCSRASQRVSCCGGWKCRPRRLSLGLPWALACSCTATRCASCRCSEVRSLWAPLRLCLARLLAPCAQKPAAALVWLRPCLPPDPGCRVCVAQTHGSWPSVQDWAAWLARMSSRGRRVGWGCVRSCVAPAA